MNTGTSELLLLGLIAVVMGILLLVRLLLELEPSRRNKWLLGIALGSGIIAFSFKILLIVTFDTFSKPIIAAHIEQDYQAEPVFNVLQHQALPASLRQKTAYIWETLPAIAPFPQDNPTTAEKVALGKKLFFEQRLSADGSLSCASCHEISLAKGGSDGLPHSIGIHQQEGTRNAPTVLNAAFQRVLFWDGRAPSLEEQAKAPFVNPVEMGMPSLESVQQRVFSLEKYRQAFSRVFTGKSPVTIDNIVKAIAAYERTLITPDSAYDRFVKGDFKALSASQLRGMALFESTGCVHCHFGPNFSGASIYGNNAIYRMFPAVSGTEYEAKYKLAEDSGAAPAKSASGRGVWRIPSLRNVSLTSPYFHNGSVADLEEAVRIMARVQLNKKLSNKSSDDRIIHWLDAKKQLLVSNDQAITDSEIKDIVHFLKALEGKLPGL